MSKRAITPMRVCRLGRAEYVATAQLQRGLRAAREAGAVEDVLLLVEHDPVITCGSRTEPAEIAYARTTDIPLVAVERGGKATYHGPGQIVAYPVFDIEVVGDDVRELVWRLEESIIDTLAGHGVLADRRDGYPGVWMDLDAKQRDGGRMRKIASVGLRLTRGVTFHGIAINVSNELEPFTWFTPCGIPDAEMTSMARELGLDGDRADPALLELLLASVEETLVRTISDHFGMEASPIGVDDVQRVAMRHEVAAPDLALPGEPKRSGTARFVLGQQNAGVAQS